MILSKENITSTLPHRPPFVMVDQLIKASTERIETSFEIHASNILCEGDFLSFPGLIENIAQTCAAGLGYISSQNGEGTKIGYIGAISKLKTYQRAKVGDTISTKVNILQEFENIILIKGANYAGDQMLVECEMKIVIAA